MKGRATKRLIVFFTLLFLFYISSSYAQQENFLDSKVLENLQNQEGTYVIIKLLDDSGLTYKDARTQEERRKIYEERARQIITPEQTIRVQILSLEISLPLL